MKKPFFLAIILLLFAQVVIAFADTIILNSGKRIEGKITEETDEYVKIDMEGVLVTYFRDEINRIVEGSIPPSPSATTSFEAETTIDTYINELQQYFLANEYDKALPILNKLTSIYSNEPEYSRLLGVVYYHLGNLSEAKIYLERAINLEPNSPYDYLSLAAIYDALGLSKEAKENLETGIRILKQKRGHTRALFAEAFLKKIK